MRNAAYGLESLQIVHYFQIERTMANCHRNV